MKKFIWFILIPIITSSVFSQGLGIGFGPSFKSVDDLTKTFKSINDLTSNNWQTVQKDMNTGFNLNARIKFGGDALKYVVNAGWNKFTIEQLSIVNPANPAEKYDLKLTQNTFPLSLGIQMGLPLSILNVYATADGVYNIIRNSVDYNKEITPGLSFGLPVMFGETTTTRIGGALGVGASLSLGVISFDVNFKLHYVNLLNKETNEASTSYMMTNVSIFFGI